jgi:hypothetical protein
MSFWSFPVDTHTMSAPSRGIRSMKKKLIAFAFASIATSAFAQAPGGGGFTPPTFEALDADKNGSLSQDEVAKFFAGRGPPGGGGGGGPNVADIFGRWDADKNGSVSKAEFDARPRQGGGGGPPPGGQAPR